MIIMMMMVMMMLMVTRSMIMHVHQLQVIMIKREGEVLIIHGFTIAEDLVIGRLPAVKLRSH